MNELLQDAYGFIFEDELIEEINAVGIYKSFKKDETHHRNWRLPEIYAVVDFRCHKSAS